MTIEEKIETHINIVVSAMIMKLRHEVLNTSITNSSYLNRTQAAKYLSCSIATIDNYVRWGNLTKYKLGKSSKFKISDLDSLLLNPKIA